MGPAPWTRQFSPWQTEIATLRCPSDPGFDLPAHGRTNYVACLGDATHWLNTGATRWDVELGNWVHDRESQVAVSGRGVFVPRQVITFHEILDGLSNTMMAGEIATDLGDQDIRTSGSFQNAWSQIHDHPKLCVDQIDPERPTFWLPGHNTNSGRPDQRRGFRWADAAAIYTGFNSILPPNSELCLAGGDSGIGMLPPSSRHLGGCHILMGDGAVSFITDSIDAGDQGASDLGAGTVIRGGVESRAAGSPSPYGVWGALGTRSSAETAETSD